MQNIASNIMIGIIAFCFVWLLYTTLKEFILPFVLTKSIKVIEKNPKWITPILREQYYGFSDIDVFIVDTAFNILPCFRVSKDKKRYELLLSEDTTTNELDKIAQVALMSKIEVKYGVLINNKSPQWMSILCYMLDGGDIKTSATKWSELENTEGRKI